MGGAVFDVTDFTAAQDMIEDDQHDDDEVCVDISSLLRPLGIYVQAVVA
jgi:hypothetical protein